MKYIFGLNKSGKSIINYLKKNNEKFYCWDDNQDIRNEIYRKYKDINLVDPLNLDFNKVKEAFISPGIDLKNKKLNFLKTSQIPLYRDLELYSRLTKNFKIIAITGTNGKSTTSKLISDVLKKQNLSNFLGGNIGRPLLDFCKNDKVKNYHVIELSSFQLESFISFSPYISILLNISKDHLDRYKNFKDYVAQKEKIINSNIKNYKIICIDDKFTREIYNKNLKKIIPISKNFIKNGIYFKDDLIIDNYFNPKKFTSIKSFSPSLFGKFNIENILSVYAVSKILNLKQDKFVSVISNFIGLPHRLETIYKTKNMQIINNSKATNLDSATKSISNYNNIFLILGGIAKEKDFVKFLRYKNNIIKVFLIGESTSIIYKQLNKFINCEKCETLDVVMKKILLDKDIKKKFSTILFSPGCSSYDQFLNFEKRGEYFKKLVKTLFK